MIALLFLLLGNQAHASTFGISLPANNLGLVGWWTFDGPDMTQNVADRSGSGNTGYIIGQPSTTTAQGKIGQALSFDGSNDYVQLYHSGATGSSITFSFWFKQDAFVSNVMMYMYSAWTRIRTDADDVIFDSSGLSDTSMTAADALALGKWNLVTITYDGSKKIIYVNGVNKVQEDATGTMNLNTGYWQLGGVSPNFIPGYFDDVRIYNRALSANEVKQLYNQGAATKVAASAPQGGALSSGLVGYWTFDGPDMVSNVRDRSGSGNTGYIIGQPSTTTAQGKIGQALSFDGVNDYVNVADAAPLNPNQVTLSSWVKTSATGGYIVAKDAIALRQAYSAYASSVSSVVVIKNDLIVVTDSYGNSDAGSSVTCSDNASGGSNTYTEVTHGHVSGVSGQSTACAIMRYAIAKASETLTVSCTGDGGDSGMSVHVYSGIDTANPLDPGYGTQAEVSASTSHTSNSITTTSANNEVLVVLYAQETTPSTFSNWTNSFAQETVQSNHVHVTADKIVSSKDTYSTGMTSSATVAGVWIMAGFNQEIPAKTNVPYALSTVNGGEFLIKSGETTYAVDSSVSVADGKWHHLVGTYDGTTMRVYVDGVQTGSGTSFSGDLPTQAGNVRVGADYEATPTAGKYFTGSLDDVRIYNRALSVNEIKALYNMEAATKVAASAPQGGALSSGLVGYWTFDGPDVLTNVADRSGLGHTGYLKFGATGNTATSSMQVPGKIGQALSFDGVNDYVVTTPIQTPSFAGSISIWLYRTSDANVNYIFDARGSDSSGTGYAYLYSGDNNVAPSSGTVYLNGALQTSSNRLNVGKWYHLVISGITLNIPKDFKIGSRLGGAETPWWGMIDDVRIYNRALSASEVKALYNMGR